MALFETRIAQIPNFQEEVKYFQKILKRAHEICLANYDPRQIMADQMECYWNDNGCGFDCLDELDLESLGQ